MSAIATLGGVVLFFFVADLVYTLDHYFVHHDRERYRRGHRRHHHRYVGARGQAEPQLDSYELTTYSSAAIVSIVGTAALSLLLGNWGFFLGAVLKYAHSLLFHYYQHKWWSETPVKKQALGAPKRGWGLATARYHAFHHSHPDAPVFTYAETWQGFDRLLEWAHPWLVRFTKDGTPKNGARQPAAAPAPVAEPAVGSEP